VIDDDAALRMMARLLVSRQCDNDWAAAETVAPMTPGQSPLSTAKRLYEKFRRDRDTYIEQVRMEKSLTRRRWSEASAGQFRVESARSRAVPLSLAVVWA